MSEIGISGIGNLKGILTKLIIGLVIGFVGGYIYEKANILQGEEVDLGEKFGKVKLQTVIFVALSILIGAYGLLKRKTGLVFLAVGIFVGADIADKRF